MAVAQTTYRLRGVTSDGLTTIAERTVEVHGNGVLKFTDAAGNPRTVVPSGALAELLNFLLNIKTFAG